MRTRTISILFILMTLFGQSATLERSGWNLMAVCQDINSSDIDMTDITEIQHQNGATLYRGEWSSFSNLESLEAGYAYWVKGDSGVSFESGEATTLLTKPLNRNGWNLMGACEETDRSDIDMTHFTEIQSQSGEIIYRDENASFSSLNRLRNGYGYWVRGDRGVSFISKRGQLSVRTESLAAYLQKMLIGTEGDNLWQIPSAEQQTQVQEIVTDILSQHYIAADIKAKSVNGEPLKIVDGDTAYYVLHLDLTRFDDGTYQALGGTYVFNPSGENSAIQVPHPKFDSKTDIEGVETFLALDSRYLLISGTHRNSSTTLSSCQSSVQASDPAHNQNHYFFNVHKMISTLDQKALFIELHGFGTTTRETIWSECDSTNNLKIVNISEGVDDLNSSSFAALLHQQLTDNGDIKSCLYSPSNDSGVADSYTSSLGGTLNVSGRFTNGSENVCTESAATASHRFVHIEQSYDVRNSDREGMIDALKTALTRANQIEVAHPFGIATQGGDPSYYYYEAPELAIDDDETTYNHTEGTAANNWWQVELPNPTLITEIRIQSRVSWASRINGAEVYITQEPYSGTLNASEKVGTLIGTSAEQMITLNEVRSGRYVLIKASGTNNLHMVNVAVYGTISQTPSFEAHSSEYLISGASEVNHLVATVSAFDYQGDALSYRIISDVPFSVDGSGNVFVNSVLEAGTYTFDIAVSDGVHEVTTTITVEVTSANAVEEALQSGDVSHVTAEELIPAAREEIERLRVGSSLLSEIYQDGSIVYATGGYSSQLITINGDMAHISPILYGNKNNVLAIAGEKEQSRFAIFASNPLYFFDRDENLDFEPYMHRIFAWLMGGEPIDMNVTTVPKTIALSFANSSSAVQSWLSTNYPSWTLKTCNDRATLESCYADADLILLGRQGNNDDAAVY